MRAALDGQYLTCQYWIKGSYLTDEIDVEKGQLKDNSDVCLGTDAALSNFYVRSCFLKG